MLIMIEKKILQNDHTNKKEIANFIYLLRLKNQNQAGSFYVWEKKNSAN